MQYFNNIEESIGNKILQIFSNSKNEAIIIAPFIKYDILDKIIANIDDSIKIRCASRWKVDEVAAGISDIEIWPLLKQRGNSCLYIYDNLHAKYYRSDNTVFIGSANLTQKAFGWKEQCNYEIMVQFDINEMDLTKFEDDLFERATPVNDELYHRYFSAVEKYKKLHLVAKPPSYKDLKVELTETFQPDNLWLPRCFLPNIVYKIYMSETEGLPPEIVQDGLRDLLSLDICPGLNEELFNELIGISLLQKPLIMQLDQFLYKPRRFGEVKQYLKNIFKNKLGSQSIDEDFTRLWQVTMRWLLYFLSERYEHFVPNYTEVVLRKQVE